VNFPLSPAEVGVSPVDRRGPPRHPFVENAANGRSFRLQIAAAAAHSRL
jgi:hypothetical protein